MQQTPSFKDNSTVFRRFQDGWMLQETFQLENLSKHKCETRQNFSVRNILRTEVFH